MGCVDANMMLKQIHQFSTNQERNLAFRDYNNWLNTQHYTHLVKNDNGDLERTECTRYIAHYERNTEADPQVYYDTIGSKRQRLVKRVIKTDK